MAISKKEAKIAAAVINSNLNLSAGRELVNRLMESVKSKGFRKSLKRIAKAMEPKKKSDMKKAA